MKIKSRSQLIGFFLVIADEDFTIHLHHGNVYSASVGISPWLKYQRALDLTTTPLFMDRDDC